MTVQNLRSLLDIYELPYLDEVKVFNKDVEQYLIAVDRHLEPYLKKAVKRVPNVPPLREGIAYQIETGGKRIRAALCATSCELFGGSYMRALSFAAAIEHLQNFMLIHDDIADDDHERRGRESIWKKYGISHGINIGDVFISLSALAILESTYSEHIKLKLLQIFSEFSLEIAEGQSLDINLRQNDSPSIEEYMECTKKKTGTFLAMATVGGAIIGGASNTHLQSLRTFAILVGIAFQIKDDILDIIGSKGRMIGSDIMEGKRTLLVVHTASEASILEKKRLFNILNKPRRANTTNEIQWVCDLFRRNGSIEYAERVAERIVKQASQHLIKLPESEAKYKLLHISKYLSKRMH